MLESRMERMAVKTAIELGWVVVKLGLKGHPDRMFLKDGRVVFIEFKTPTGKLSEKQKARIKEYSQVKHTVHVCRSVNEAKKLLSNA